MQNNYRLYCQKNILANSVCFLLKLCALICTILFLCGCAYVEQIYPLCTLGDCEGDGVHIGDCILNEAEKVEVQKTLPSTLGASTQEITFGNKFFVVIRATEKQHERIDRYWSSIGCFVVTGRGIEVKPGRYRECIHYIPQWMNLFNNNLTVQEFLDMLLIEPNYRRICVGE